MLFRDECLPQHTHQQSSRGAIGIPLGIVDGHVHSPNRGLEAEQNLQNVNQLGLEQLPGSESLRRA